MRKKRTVALLILIVTLAVSVPLMAINISGGKPEEVGVETCSLTIWEIDGFEGGKGSRKQFLKTQADKLFAEQKCYLTVTQLTADSARKNLKIGNVPDMISYPAGFYGIESLVNSRDFTAKSWCNGSYYLFCLDTNSTFDDANSNNTVLNEGKGNFTDICALLCGLDGADSKSATNAYLKLLDGTYKYLLGTQRDFFRFKTRNVTFACKQVEQFNDLYQNVSILTNNEQKYKKCAEYVNYLTREDNGVGKLGLMHGDLCELDDALKENYVGEFNYYLKTICSADYIYQLRDMMENKQANKIKNLLK